MVSTQKSYMHNTIIQEPTRPRRSERQKIPSAFYAGDYEDPQKIGKRLMMKYSSDSNQSIRPQIFLEGNEKPLTSKNNRSTNANRHHNIDKESNDEWLTFRTKDDPSKLKFVCFSMMDNDAKSSGFSSEISSSYNTKQTKTKGKTKNDKSGMKHQSNKHSIKKEPKPSYEIKTISSKNQQQNFLDKVLIAAMRVRAMRSDPNESDQIKEEAVQNDQPSIIYETIPLQNPQIATINDSKTKEEFFVKKTKIDKNKLIFFHSILGPITAKYRTEKKIKVDISSLENSTIFDIAKKQSREENGIEKHNDDFDNVTNLNQDKKDDIETVQQKIQALRTHFREVFKANKPSIIV